MHGQMNIRDAIKSTVISMVTSMEQKRYNINITTATVVSRYNTNNISKAIQMEYKMMEKKNCYGTMLHEYE